MTTALETPKTIPPEYVWNRIPEILYEAPSHAGEKGNPIPYIDVPAGKKMPAVLFMFGYHSTGEFEPDHRGKPQEIVDQIPYKFVTLEFLLSQIGDEFQDKVRCALGMKPLAQAQSEGKAVLDRVMGRTDALTAEAVNTQGDRVKKVQADLDAAKKAASKRKRKAGKSK